MTAIVSSSFRLNAAKEFISDATSTSTYYLFIGRSEAWTNDASPDNPYDNTYSTFTDAWQRMTAMKKLVTADIVFGAPRYQWISGTTYAEYDDRDSALEGKQYFVISDNNNVYICLKSGGVSTVNPDTTGVQTSGVINQSGSDGYIWKYLFTVSTGNATKFLTSAFIPLVEITSDPGVSADTALRNQWDVQQNAVHGAIYNVKIAAGGSGYTSTPTVTISGDGSGCTATATVVGGVVTDITVTAAGSGYNQATVTITGGGGSGATARVVHGPKNGFGYDARNELRAHFCNINTQLIYADGSGDFIVGNDFRQIGLIKNPFNFGTTTVATADTLSATKSLTIAVGGTFAADSVFEGTVTGAKGVVDHYDATNGIIRYHQTEATGFTNFTTSDFVRPNGTSGSGQDVTAVNNPEAQPYSGDVVFLENRAPINRAGDQIETIKLVLEF